LITAAAARGALACVPGETCLAFSGRANATVDFSPIVTPYHHLMAMPIPFGNSHLLLE